MDVAQAKAKLEVKARAKAHELVDQAPSHALRMVRNGVGAAAAGLAADRIFKATASKGVVPAVVVAIGGAAVARGSVETAFAVGSNLYGDKPAFDGVAPKALDGMRKGAINGGLTLIAAPILKEVSVRYPTLTAVKAGAVAGSIRGGIGSFVGNATDPDTWQDGVGMGMLKVGGSTVAGMAGGYVSGGWGKNASNWALQRLEPYIDFTSINLDWLDWDTIVGFIKPD